MNKILFVDDDSVFALMLKNWLHKKGYEVTLASTMADGYKQFCDHEYQLCIVDLRLPDGMGIELLKQMKSFNPAIPVIMLTGYADIHTAVTAMQYGAFDYLTKPIPPEELLSKIEQVLKKDTPKVVTESAPTYIEGVDEKSRKLYHHLSLVAPTDMSVLIRGESGTGKEYVAKRIHLLSKRKDAKFVPVDCGSIPKDLAASEFFGHIKGSFTGAVTDKVGLLEEADGGTIFLDEVGNLNYDIQVLLLRALQEKRIKPVGGTIEKTVDIRVISATNENLEEAVAKGEFREDLYHRLNEFTLIVPPLRERKADIPMFLNLFLDQANSELGKDVVGFSPDVEKLLTQYRWSGNLREMKNMVKRACLLTQGEYIDRNALSDEFLQIIEQPQEVNHFVDNEQERIIAALRETRNNKSKAAQLLQIDRKTLYNKLAYYGITGEEI
ncbi:MAG: sigma-54-dependent transcriptional regulator [Marinifilaceae bacterium]